MTTRAGLACLSLTLAALAGCTSSPPAPPEILQSPVASTSTDVPDTSGVIPRFTNDIWPAVVACNGACDQGGARHAKFTKIVVPGLDADHYGRLRDAVQKLGTVQEADQSQGGIYRDDELRLADTALTALDPPSAVLQVCYSFTARSNPAGSQQPKLEPATSEATVELRKTDNWYLYSITNDHVVPGCPASPKA
ncbi:hypothetical protein [Mycobacteroides abscessus]|uniref:hypothetical protein n=1 Tax=Mycobacteroides abscessus TaxID=36809 RepID=UPI0018A448D9|nr:hypothetical protein [Mycobacteroides abscessus]MBE5462043.1 hypothetical protein [Mycobacteroides abscessus]QOF42824.1 hypothetical protein E3G69_001865 [Mycobacteroides abscessus]QOF47522.1 hypothetical protein E3G70_001863 [Mycobacteroides abscessus]